VCLTGSDESGDAGGELDRLGEFGLIARLTNGLEMRPDVLLAAGDDAAVLDTGAGDVLVATCDAQVEGVHFRRDVATCAEIGHKALAVNLSDIAAMGAEPRWALVSLLIPSKLQTVDLDQMYMGMRTLAEVYSVALVGGNISSTPGPFCIDITLLGTVGRGRALLRTGAANGDRILLTGPLGAAAAGALWAVEVRDPAAFSTLSPKTRERTRTALVAPVPQIRVGQALADTGVVSAMIDVSDGLAADLGHICQMSHVGAVLEAERLPVDPAAGEVASAYGRDPLALSLYGGEDYGLLCTVGEQNVEIALAAIARAGGEGHVIGRIVKETEGLHLMLLSGELAPLKVEGWDHLRGKTSR
jgi:thiamine-monophosphate kinase